MREIKYRAFRSKSKEMGDVLAIDFVDPVMVLCMFYTSDKKFRYQSTEKSEDIELMQYTGMKDKNDVEIYEGDIVEFVNKDGDKSYYEVKFHNGSWAVICPNCMPDWLDGEQHTFAVVGNIYENQDLLK